MVLGGTRARRPQIPDGVGVVEHQHRAELFTNLEQPRRIGDIALHAEHTVHHDHASDIVQPRGALRLQLASQTFQITVFEPRHLAVRQPAAVDDAGVVQLVQVDLVVPTHQRPDDAQVRLVARAEHQRRFGADELRQPHLQPLVQVRIAVQESTARTAAAVFLERSLGRLDYAGVVGEPHIVVRADHDLALTVDVRLGVVRPLDRHEIRVIPRRHDLTGTCEVAALIENVHPLPRKLERASGSC